MGENTETSQNINSRSELDDKKLIQREPGGRVREGIIKKLTLTLNHQCCGTCRRPPSGQGTPRRASSPLLEEDVHIDRSTQTSPHRPIHTDGGPQRQGSTETGGPQRRGSTETEVHRERSPSCEAVDVAMIDQPLQSMLFLLLSKQQAAVAHLSDAPCRFCFTRI